MFPPKIKWTLLCACVLLYMCVYWECSLLTLIGLARQPLYIGVAICLPCYLKATRSVTMRFKPDKVGGPWGGDHGNFRDIQVPPYRLLRLTIYSQENVLISSISFSYIGCDGCVYHEHDWGFVRETEAHQVRVGTHSYTFSSKQPLQRRSKQKFSIPHKVNGDEVGGALFLLAVFPTDLLN
ncbi:hypothetical protein PVAP13_6KG073780 [Panicum virgatum]|uniref:Uncharacterized protein n=1 Tax=Panicum virgatum TaxID=38727 RepID=A0A8T0R6G7_PANVG|nr:hypothetical protein PVAP13_6KG073780 [Panicum virgatum]